MLPVQFIMLGLAAVIGVALIFAAVNVYRHYRGLPTGGIYAIGSFTGVLAVMAGAFLIGFIAVGLYALEQTGS